MNRKWRIAIKREGLVAVAESQSWRPTEYSRVCGANFRPDDFKQTLASMYSTKPTTRRYLKGGVVSSLFPWLTPAAAAAPSSQDHSPSTTASGSTSPHPGPSH